MKGLFTPRLNNYSYMNDSLWKKSYMLEFVKNNVPIEVFTFSVPPQSEDFDFPQRVNETKTFGGSVIEDYGNDIGKITLSGTTINQSVKKIFKGTNSPSSFLNGEQEIFELKDILKKWGKNENLVGNKRVYLYSLDSSSVTKWWEVFPQDLQIKRSKDNPLAWNYTITFLAAPETITSTATATYLTYKNSLKKFVSMIETPFFLTDIINNINDLLDQIDTWVDNLNYFRNYINGYSNAVSNIKAVGKRVENSILAIEKVAQGYVDDSINAVDETVSLGKQIFSSYTRIKMNIVDDMYASAIEMKESVAEFKNIIKATDYTNLKNGSLNGYSESEEKIQDVFNSTVRDMENASNKIYENALQAITNSEIVIIPGTDGNSDEVIQIYGFTTKVIKYGDTWDSIAAESYGNPSLGIIIAAYNGSTGMQDLDIGDEILIPVLSESNTDTKNNFVYNVPGKKSNYGSDIKIGIDGDIEVLNGDLSTTKEVETLTQAINNRLKTVSGSRIRDVVYGIKANIGNASDAVTVFVAASIEQTILEDPRVKTVKSIHFLGSKDNLKVDVEYVDINDRKQSFGGVI